MLGAECQVASCQTLIVGTWWKLHKQLLQEDGLEDHKGLGLWPSLNIAMLPLICLDSTFETADDAWNRPLFAYVHSDPISKFIHTFCSDPD